MQREYEGAKQVTKEQQEAMMKSWRKMHGLPEEEGWYKKGDDGKWACGENPGVTQCKGAPQTVEDALDEMKNSEDADTQKIGKKASRLMKFLKYLGAGLFYSSLFELLLAHSQAMSGCFLVPLAIRDKDGNIIPSMAIFLTKLIS